MIRLMPYRSRYMRAFAALVLLALLVTRTAFATVTSSTAAVTFLGNGATSTFSYSFPIPAASNVVLTYTDASGNQTVIPSNQYTITGLGSTGGFVTYPKSGSPIANGTKLTLQRVLPFTQTIVFNNQGPFNADTLELALDTLAMQIQQLAANATLNLRFPIVDSNNGLLVSAAQRANKALGFDASGNPLMLTPSGGGGGGGVSSVALAMPAEFSVAGSPVTSSGTLTVTKASQAQNAVFAGPSTGGAGTPTFRALTTADMPGGFGTGTITGVTAGTGLTGGGTSGNVNLALATGAAATNLGYTPLRPSNNLSDVSTPATARTNLGLGSAATLASSAVLQAANNLSDLASAATARSNLGVPLGTSGATVPLLSTANTWSLQQIFSGGIGLQTRTITASGAVSTLTTDSVVIINKTVAGATALTLVSVPAKTIVVVKDGKGDAAANNITVTPAVGTVDGAANAVINANYGRLWFVFDGTNWSIL